MLKTKNKQLARETVGQTLRQARTRTEALLSPHHAYKVIKNKSLVGI